MTAVGNTRAVPIPETDTIINRALRTINALLNREMIVFISISIILIAWLLFNRKSETCDMTLAENLDFNKYYGIDDLRNHFTTPTADECNPSIIYRPALPQSILKTDHSASSFLTLAKYGTGKTLVRCEYYNSLQKDNYFKILILNKQIKEYLERFVTETKTKDKNCEEENCLLDWSDDDFAQLMLSVLATDFINTYHNQKIIFDYISIDEKMELIYILSYYYNGYGTDQLEQFFNSFLNKINTSQYKAKEIQTQIQERNIWQDKPVLIHLKDDFKKFKVLKKDNERIHLLLGIIEGEGFQSAATTKNMFGNVFKDLTQLSLFIKKYLNKIPVFIIDGIDENRYFFQGNQINKPALEKFCLSSVSQELIANVMANHFYLSIFYPKIEGINIGDAAIKKDKFPTHTINWNRKSLINYADYVLQQLNKNASTTRCKSFKDFSTLVNFSNKRVTEIIEKIPTPRALHYFMMALITEMNTDAAHVSVPFQATFENVHNAFEQSFEFYHKRHKIME